MAERQDSRCKAARDRSTPLRVARTEISRDIIAKQSLPVAVGKFNGFNTYDIFSIHKFATGIRTAAVSELSVQCFSWCSS